SGSSSVSAPARSCTDQPEYSRISAPSSACVEPSKPGFGCSPSRALSGPFAMIRAALPASPSARDHARADVRLVGIARADRLTRGAHVLRGAGVARIVGVAEVGAAKLGRIAAGHVLRAVQPGRTAGAGRTRLADAVALGALREADEPLRGPVDARLLRASARARGQRIADRRAHGQRADAHAALPVLAALLGAKRVAQPR